MPDWMWKSRETGGKIEREEEAFSDHESAARYKADMESRGYVCEYKASLVAGWIEVHCAKGTASFVVHGAPLESRPSSFVDLHKICSFLGNKIREEEREQEGYQKLLKDLSFTTFRISGELLSAQGAEIRALKYIYDKLDCGDFQQ